MIRQRPFGTLGRIDRNWLEAKLHFCHGKIGPDERARLGALHIWNDDTFAPHAGFGMHAHENVEIITFVRSGAITHEDSFGNKARIAAGDVQVMSAGEGVLHSERNEENEPARLYQIWLTPRSRNTPPRWATRRVNLHGVEGSFIVLASGHENEVAAGALSIDARARFIGATLRAGQSLVQPMSDAAMAYLVTTTGRIRANDVELAPRDGAAIENEVSLTVTSIGDTSILMIELLSAPVPAGTHVGT
ncbi:pirin family protein [Caballeronia sp. LZ019]|uniref:pirin family protein n=1 Tax=Caballeronia sp. LZ019 TaxID=3038555 RepID=UPI00285FCFCE|nr:pirin family protein [Caballeronia sp. LZ019]MDR5809180.1 pirin family protein [Caballeronia sp. LZ019]